MIDLQLLAHLFYTVLLHQLSRAKSIKYIHFDEQNTVNGNVLVVIHKNNEINLNSKLKGHCRGTLLVTELDEIKFVNLNNHSTINKLIHD